jgi:hypothetical protein
MAQLLGLIRSGLLRLAYHRAQSSNSPGRETNLKFKYHSSTLMNIEIFLQSSKHSSVAGFEDQGKSSYGVHNSAFTLVFGENLNL